MKIYLADSCKNNLEAAHSHAQEHFHEWHMLVSYHYFKNVNLDEWFTQSFSKPYPRVFLDSGAFSAMTQGVNIDIDAYARYIHRYRHLIEVYANLDVIKNAEATMRNQERLEKDYGLMPLPVFHVTEPWDMLEWYLDRYPYIALGVAGTRSGVYMPWLVQCFKRLRGRAVYHGFGITTWRVMTSFPWYSVDSTTWASSLRYGSIHLFDSSLGRFVTPFHGDRRSCYRYARLFRALGFDPSLFADRKHESYRPRAVVSMLSYLQAEAWLTKRWGEIIIPTREEVAG